jgi:preprotein translocase subunit SecE
VATARETIQQSTQFFQEVWTELKKVHWPSWQETRGATIVVILAVLLMSAYLGLVDFLLAQVVERLLAPRVG